VPVKHKLSDVVSLRKILVYFITDILWPIAADQEGRFSKKQSNAYLRKMKDCNYNRPATPPGINQPRSGVEVLISRSVLSHRLKYLH
jgi:hypothetical protein